MPRRGRAATPSGRQGGGGTPAAAARGGLEEAIAALPLHLAEHFLDVPDEVADAIGDRVMQSLDLSEEASIASSAALNARARSLGLPELSTSTARGRSPPPRATHECDACGAGGASRTCSACRSVCYCGAAC